MQGLQEACGDSLVCSEVSPGYADPQSLQSVWCVVRKASNCSCRSVGPRGCLSSFTPTPCLRPVPLWGFRLSLPVFSPRGLAHLLNVHYTLSTILRASIQEALQEFQEVSGFLPFYRPGNERSERLSNLLEATQLVSRGDRS